ncbi:Amiloride-sensitive amine oxidase copper-containing, partial [Taenia solium]
IDHTDDEQSLWSVIGLNIQGHRFGSIDEFLSVKPRWSSLFVRKITTTNPFADSHTRLLSGLCPRARPSGSSTASFPATIVNKHVSYGPWQFDVAVRHETGLRFYNVYFNHQLMIHEVGLDETVTIYGGETPFMRALTSLESMFSVGSLTSELSPGIDCPVDAVFLTVPIIVSPSAGASTVHNGICIYASAADVHEGALRRYVHPHGEDPTQPDPGYATGTVKKALYVVTQAAIFNYHYAFVNIFSPSGTYASYVVPSGYIHVDVPHSTDHLFGFVSPWLDLRFNIHTHRFLFFIDALGVNNTVEQTRVYAEGRKSGLDRMSMQVTKVRTEREGQFQGGDPTTSLALCLAGATNAVNSQCLQIINTAPVPSMVSQNSSRSFAWIRRSLWFTKYKENELRASSIYNGVDLTDPVVDFAEFSTDEALDEDVVMWVNVGFIHIPGNEDIPHTPSRTSQLGLILRPQNFFPQTPDGPTNAGYVFTTDCAPPGGNLLAATQHAIEILLKPLKELVGSSVYPSGKACEGSWTWLD